MTSPESTDTAPLQQAHFRQDRPEPVLPGDSNEPVWRRILRVPLRDGVELVADLYTCAEDPEPAPVLLERTPYGRRQVRPSDGLHADGTQVQPEQSAAYFARRGFHVVRQDCRGRGDSQGEFVKYIGEAADGYDTVEWLAAQPWCDGRVATMGVSYSAHAQTALASLAPPHLAAMFVDSGGFASAYEAGVRMGGAFELKQATWAYHHALQSPAALRDPVVRASLERQDLHEWFRALPWRRGASPLRAVPEYENYLIDQWEHGAFDDYWRRQGLYGRGYYGHFPDVPSLHMVSWYDPYVLTAVENFQALSQRQREPVYLVVGPWTHGARSVTHAGDVDFGSDATFERGAGSTYLDFRARWFTQHLTGTDTSEPRVRFFLMGGGSGRRTSEGRLDHGGRWLTAQTWPPAQAREQRLYLRASGRLTEDPPSDPTDSHVEYDFDPANPVPTLGGQVTSAEPLMRGGAYDQHPDERTYGSRPPHLPLAARPDVLVFQTEPLVGPLAVAGPIQVCLAVSSTAPDTDFTIKLIDVHPPNADYPDGYAMNLTDGILRCRYRHSYENPTPMEPARLYTVTVTAPDTANLFATGHRIRLDVSSSNFPRFDVNPNTGEPEATSRRRMIATNRVHLSPEHPSWLTLHILPCGSPHGTTLVQPSDTAD